MDAPEIVLSILPSYQMYNSLFHSVRPDCQTQPPGYLRSSLETSDRTQLTAATSVDEDLEVSINLVDNLHALEDLDRPGFTMEVHFTKDVCKMGEAPEEAPYPARVEQGEYLHGYITIDNDLDTLYFFDQFFVMLEGVYKTKNGRKLTFLQMFDFGASYNLARINRLPEENASPFIYRESPLDLVDGRIACFQRNQKVYRCFQAGGRYKRYFSFKLPQRLLDCHCAENVPEHLALPPTITKDDHVGYADITYAITSRIITRRRNLNPERAEPTLNSAEFVILKQAAFPLVVSPHNTMVLLDIENEELAERLYKNLLARIDEMVHPVQQHAKGEVTHISGRYKVKCPVSRRALGMTRTWGLLEVSLKKVVHPAYVNDASGMLTIPIALSFKLQNLAAPPEIRLTLVSLHEISYETTTPMPFALGAFLFNNQVKEGIHDMDTLDYTINHVRNQATKLYQVLKKEGLSLEKELVDAIKAVCQLEWTSKTHTMPKFNAKSTISKRANALPWQRAGPREFCKLFHIEVDYRHFMIGLTPLFQLCRVGKFYLLKITFVLNTGQKMNLKLPILFKR